MHSKHRRGRAAALNMVITETGAASAAVKAIPSLGGKLTANAVRVPTPNGSLAIMNLTVSKQTNINDTVRKISHLRRVLVTKWVATPSILRSLTVQDPGKQMFLMYLYAKSSLLVSRQCFLIVLTPSSVFLSNNDAARSRNYLKNQALEPNREVFVPPSPCLKQQSER